MALNLYESGTLSHQPKNQTEHVGAQDAAENIYTKQGRIMGGWRKVCNEDLLLLIDIVKMAKPRRIDTEGFVGSYMSRCLWDMPGLGY